MLLDVLGGSGLPLGTCPPQSSDLSSELRDVPCQLGDFPFLDRWRRRRRLWRWGLSRCWLGSWAGDGIHEAIDAGLVACLQSFAQLNLGLHELRTEAFQRWNRCVRKLLGELVGGVDHPSLVGFVSIEEFLQHSPRPHFRSRLRRDV